VVNLFYMNKKTEVKFYNEIFNIYEEF